MGKHRRGGRGGPKTPGRDEAARKWVNFDVSTAKNESFEAYYRAQGVLAEEEFETFMSSLRRDLPTTFRVTGSRAHAETINDIIKNTYVPTMQNVEVDGTVYNPPSQIPWYPGSLAWQLEAPKRVVRRSLPFKNFQRFLVGETEVGNLSRQEAVSMIPPIFLDVEPHHTCLDMCAAPGSKTAQIIEALNPHHTPSSGLLIANDVDYKRTHMLVHQTGRMPSRGLMVTNFDASMIPNISLGPGKTLQFDRILTDVPCSGDGTLRKNAEIWTKWAVQDGNSLHTLQLRIVNRAMDLLAPDGRLVYSTCSFNPIEDEAIIAAALATHPTISIVDVSDRHTVLKRRPGLTSWKVAVQKEGRGGEITYYEKYEDYKQDLDGWSDGERGRGLGETMWPPANAKEIGLDKCLRLYPHDQDTGGFFVCVLHKAAKSNSSSTSATTSTSIPPTPAAVDTPPIDAIVASADEAGVRVQKRALSPSAEAITASEVGVKKAKPEEEGIEGTDTADAPAPVKTKAPAPVKKQKRDLGWREDPFGYVDPQHQEVQTVVDWFKFDEKFARDCLMVRNEEGNPLRTMYMTNEIVKTILTNNESSRLRVIAAGIKGFVRQDSQARGDITCKWRVPSEGVLDVLPHMPESAIRVIDLGILKLLLEQQYPSIEAFSAEAQAWLNTEVLGNIITKVEAGSGHGGSLPLPIYLPVWIAKTSVSLLIDKREKSTLSLRIFGEDICQATGMQNKGEKVKPADDENVDEAVDDVKEEDVANGEEEAIAAGGVDDAA